jgi:DNA-binding CsgD family transcriptional regulator
MTYFSPPLARYSTILQLLLYGILLLSCSPDPAKTLPEQYRAAGAFVKGLPYYNPDSCVLLIRRDVPPEWQGATYENLFLGGPEDSPLELGFKHLDLYEKNFPADSAHAFTQLWRGRLYIHLNKLFNELPLRLNTVNHDAPIDNVSEKLNMVKGVRILNTLDWDVFRERCDTLFPGIVTKLKEPPYSLSTAETRLFLLMKLKFTSAETSEVLGISRESVWRSRHRLAKKVGLSDTMDLDGFVDNFV